MEIIGLKETSSRYPAGYLYPKHRQVLLVNCLVAFMCTLDASIVNIALPRIAHDFQCSLAQVSWVMIAYLLTNASLLLISGRLGDLLAPGRLYLLGLLVFTGASALCGLSPSLSWLVAGRALQGLGSSLILALSPKLIALSYGEGKRGQALGLVSGALATGFAVGASLGGLITAHFGWPYIFFINIPICGLALIAGSHPLMRLPGEGAWDWKAFNLWGGLILAGALWMFYLALDWFRDIGYENFWTLGSFGVALGLLGLLLFQDRRHDAPLLHPELWLRRAFILGSVGIMFACTALSGTFFLLPFFLEHIYFYSPHHSELLLAALASTCAIAAPLGGRLADRVGNVLILKIGSGFLLLGLISLLFTGLRDSTFSLALKLALIELGYGLFLPPNLNEVLRETRPSMVGLAGSSVSLLKRIGSIIGITIIIAVFAWVHQHHILLGPGVYLEIEYFQMAFAAMALIGVFNLLTQLIPRASRT